MKIPFLNRARCFCLALSFAITGWLTPSADAAGPVGINTGISDTANVLTVGAGCGWVRIGVSLPSGHTTWDSYSLGQLDNMVNSAKSAGLQLILLLNGNGAWPGEGGRNVNSGGSGTNAYITGFVNNAVIPIIQRVHDRVKFFEIWNEPSTSATYVEPACYAQMLTSSWIAAHKTLGYSDVTIIAGDGGDGSWLNSVYYAGTHSPCYCFASAKSLYGTYPVDGFAQHIYIDQLGGSTLASDYQNYINTYHNYYANSTYEGTTTTKGMYITEFGFDTVYMLNNGIGTEAEAEQLQANNIDTALHVLNPGLPGSFIKLAILYAWNDYTGAGFGLTLADQTTHKTDYNYYKNDASFEGHTGMNNGNNNNNILNYFNARGQAILGSPLNFVHTWSGGAFSALVQDCNGGSNLRLCILTTSLGTFEVNDVHGLWDYYYGHGGIGFFGAPKNDESTVGGVTRQNFQNGFLTQDSVNGIVWHKPKYDFSGDGKSDVITFHRGTTGDPNLGHVWVGTSGPGNIFTSSLWNQNFCLNAEIPAVGDFNGDGKCDVATFLRGASGNVYVGISSGTAFGTGAIWNANPFCINNEIPLAGDFDGDGKDDIITFHRGATGDPSLGHVWVAKSTGTGFATSSLWDSSFCISNEVPVVGDFDGDGKADIATFLTDTSGKCYVALSTGSSFGSSSVWNTLICTNGEIPFAADVNGDGKDDILIFHRANDGNQGVWVSLSNGSSFGARQKWASGFSVNSDQPGAADFGADGMADVVDFNRGTNGTVYVEFSTGTNFAPPPAVWNTWFGVGSEVVMPGPTPVIWP